MTTENQARETRGTAPPDFEKKRRIALEIVGLVTAENGLNSSDSYIADKVEEKLDELCSAERVSQPVAPPPPIDEERFRRIVKFLSENEAFCQVTPTNGAPWGFGLGEATRTFTLHTCKNGCGFYVKNQGDECLSCSAKWLVEQINKLRAAPGTHPPQEGWISVEDRLPEIKKVEYDVFSESDFCLIFIPEANRVEIAQYTVTPKAQPTWDTINGSSLRSGHVTHWQPSPTPPKKRACAPSAPAKEPE